MDRSGASTSSDFLVFLASQVKANDKGFLSRDITVRDLIEGLAHNHHVFPRDYLKTRLGLPRSRYNQIANYVVIQSEINIALGNTPPATYFQELWRQCESGTPQYGGIVDADQLRANYAQHCIPHEMFPDSGEPAKPPPTSGLADGERQRLIEEYDEFLQKRRKLMAAKMRDYYQSL